MKQADKVICIISAYVSRPSCVLALVPFKLITKLPRFIGGC